MTTSFDLNRDLYLRAFFTLCATAFILFFADSAFAGGAASYDSNDVVGNTLCKLTNNLTGNTAKAVATIAIFTTGISLFMGKVQWTTAAMVAIGVAVVFGANSLVGFISGSAGSCVTS